MTRNPRPKATVNVFRQVAGGSGPDRAAIERIDKDHSLQRRRGVMAARPRIRWKVTDRAFRRLKRKTNSSRYRRM